MKIGITGTRSQLTGHQIKSIIDYLKSVFTIGSELHHGDCVGADAHVASLAKEIGYKIVCHPPMSNDLRANFESDEIRNPLSYFARNRNIVDETDFLIVAPYQNEWQSFGGTWYTHDYAVKKNKQLRIFFPDSDNVIQLMNQGR